jgi:3-isopropylmalate/(R)-2-methylmalate dehydratase large subunit
MEWNGKAINDLSIDERMTLTNMAIEAGAKSGIIAPDEKTKEFIEQKRGKLSHWQAGLKSDDDASFANSLNYDASELEPLVATPSLPSNVKPARELRDVKINQAYIGSCTGGKLEDFVKAAEILKGERVAKGVRLLVVPATQKIYRKLLTAGLFEVFLDAGAVISAPTCGACLGGHMGVLASEEVCISSTNRNFRGRMGDPSSKVYLASPMTVAASAIAGYIKGVENE